MITLEKVGNALKFTFSGNSLYLQDGTIEVPLNSLTLVTDTSDLATFKKSASNDIFVSAPYSELGMTKLELETWFKNNACSTGGGGGGGVTPQEVQTMIDESISGKADTTDVTALNGVVTAHTADTTIHVTAADKTAWNAKSDFSGSYNDLSDKPTIPTVPTSNTAFTNDAGYITSDALVGYAESTAVTQEISEAVSGKADTSSVYTKSETSGATEIATALSGKQDTLSAGTNITIVDNVISATGGGGGTTYTAGRGIDITNDTISVSLPISAGTGTNSIKEGDSTTASGNYSHAEGYYSNAQAEASHAEGYSTAKESYCHSEGYATIAHAFRSHAEGAESVASGDTSHAEGKGTITSNHAEHASGAYNVSSSASATFGNSGNTLFSVGNGTEDNARHNAFEIRQNGDIYCNNGTSDVKLQDYLQIKVVKITQAAYDALSPDYDNNVLYVIV